MKLEGARESALSLPSHSLVHIGIALQNDQSL